MATRRALRTARSAGLVAVAAAVAFSLTACQGGGQDAAAVPEKKDSVATSRATGDSDGLSGSKTSADKPQTSSATDEAASPVRTRTLVDGSKAEIYELGDQHYRAKIVSDGSVMGTLETKGHDAGLDANGMFVVLTLGGQVNSWIGGGHSGPGTFKLAGGWTAKVTKIGELRYRAQILGNEGEVATLGADQHDVGLDANGVYIVLTAGGVISSHL